MVRARLDTTLRHVLSQLLGRWFPPGEQGDADTEPLHEIQPAVWREQARELLARDECAQAYELLTKRGDPETVLAAATHRHLACVTRHGGTYLTFHDARYPRLLRPLEDPPLALTILGDVDLLQLPAVALIGSRKASAHALQATFNLACQFAEAGHLVVSGGALGCDGAAHAGALAATRRPTATAIVFANGLAELYPKFHRRLFDDILATGGLWVTERLWWQSCRPHDFPARNRIISGLCEVTYVMQASERSGAMVTASRALTQGREVVVLEHPEDDIRAAGSRLLLEDGAMPLDAVSYL